MNSEKRYCQNCSVELHGEFCSSCGQRDKELHLPIKELAMEFIDFIPSFDKRIIRSLIPFIVRPGFLTKEYLSGKRKQYISPFKLYFFISFLYFFSSNFNVSETKKNIRNDLFRSDSVKTIVNGDSTALSIRSSDSGVSFTIADTAKIEKLFGKKNIEGFKSGSTNPQMFFEKIREHLPKIIFLLLPVFALLMRLVYIRSKIFYIEHLIFSFYFHSFIFFILFLDTIIELVLPKGFTLYGNIILLSIPVYLYAGLKNVYAQSRWKTFIKFTLLSLSHGIVFILTLSAFVIATVFIFFT